MPDTLELPERPRPTLNVTRIEFDGGTSCNRPASGFGDGYGSYRIDDRPIVRLSYKPMSNNCAEVLTLVFAVEDAKRSGATAFFIVGDSQIALRWADIAAGNRKLRGGKGTREFQQAISILIRALKGYRVSTQWQPREVSVITFGH